jgi:hypothetical protein
MRHVSSSIPPPASHKSSRSPSTGLKEQVTARECQALFGCTPQESKKTKNRIVLVVVSVVVAVAQAQHVAVQSAYFFNFRHVHANTRLRKTSPTRSNITRLLQEHICTRRTQGRPLSNSHLHRPIQKIWLHTCLFAVSCRHTKRDYEFHLYAAPNL